MAKDRHHSHQTSRKRITDYHDNNNKCGPRDIEVERVSEHRDLLSEDLPNTPVKALDKLAQKIGLEYPFILTDGNKRTWLFEDSFGDAVEYQGYPPGLSSYRRHFTIADNFDDSEEEDVPEELSSNCDSSERGFNWEAHASEAGKHSREVAKEKRPPDAIRCPSLKRRAYSRPPKKRTPYTAQEDGESDTTDESEGEEEEEEEDEFAGITFENQGVRISEIRGTMVDILRKLQQKGLKQVLKAILRKCHPQKQVKFPYNGGKLQEEKKKRGDADCDVRNPGLLTAPDYWLHQDDWKPYHGHIPTGCRHREPDHVYKPERINLAMHLLHAGDQYQDAKFGLANLRESTIDITSDYPKEFQPDAERLIEALFYAREKEIQFENGEIDAETVVYVPMPVQRPSKPKRMTRNQKVVKKVKQDTPETSGFFDLCTPFNHSSSANSSFTSSMKKTVKVESESSTPFPGAASSHIDASVAGSNTPPKQLDFQASLYPSTPATQDLGPIHADTNTLAPSEGDTEAESLEDMVHEGGLLKQAESQSPTPRPASQLALDNINNRDIVVEATNMNPPASVAQAMPTFRPDIPALDLHNSEIYMSIAEPQGVAANYINPADIYMRPSNDNHNISNHTTSITNSSYPILSPAQTTFFPLPHPHEDHLMAPPPTPILAQSMEPNPLVNSHPACTSSGLHGAMPINQDWHPDLSCEHDYNENYRHHHHQHGLPFTSMEGQPGPQQGSDGHFWPGNFNAIAHASGDFTVQSGNGAMCRRSSTLGVLGHQEQEQQQQQQQQNGPYTYPFLQQERRG